MKDLIGGRKIMILALGLVAFVLALWLMQLKDSASILSTGTSIVGLVSAAIYGNIQEHRAEGHDEAK